MKSAAFGPARLRGLLQITGIGERKAELYGRQILDALKRFRDGPAPRPLKRKSRQAKRRFG